MRPYDHKEIEQKWQKEWESAATYKTTDSAKPKQYVLDMFPYPSGAGLHVGHPRGYIASDVFARFKRMQGFNVLHPMGFDSFGLPAEQYAIKTGNHPGPYTDELIEHYKKQLTNIGFSYDWSRQVATHKPEYYKWTQWIFLKLYNSWYNPETNKTESIDSCIAKLSKEDPKWNEYSEKEKQDILMKYRIAYEGYAEVNWCPELGTVLANDEIITAPDGSMVSERGEYPVIKKSMRQWFMRISSYADRLLSGLDTIDWPHGIKEIQRNWIGKSEGSEITFYIEDKEFGKFINNVDVFTTRADTLYGVTYIALAVDHPAVETLLKKEITNWDEVYTYIQKVKQQDQTDLKEITGIKLEGVVAKQSFMEGFEVPVYLTNYVLGTYGTGAVMGVPAHDERDFEFAKKYELPIKVVIHPESVMVQSDETEEEVLNKYLTGERVYTSEFGHLINSTPEFEGRAIFQAKKDITKKVGGKIVTKYKMRDAIFARQRYWGEPIPLRHTADGLIEPLIESELPLKLPDLADFAPAGDAGSPLSKSAEWREKGYETNTMPGWAGSSWYFLRYMDPHNDDAFASEDAVKYWGQVDMYVGGAEHATGHLLYSRFWNMALYDLGYVPFQEPFKALRNQGLIAGPDGRKMSKRWGNVINPDDVIAQLGADTLRVYESFMGPFESHLPWSTDGIVGSRRFIERMYRNLMSDTVGTETTPAFQKVLHKTIKKVTDDIATFSFNTAISAMMICNNEFEKAERVSKDDAKIFLQLLAPFAPHMTEELWYELGETSSIHLSEWPKADEALLVDDTVTIGVQINGKVRDELTIAVSATKQEIETAARELSRIKEYTEGKSIKNVIVVPGRIINILTE